MPFVLGHLGCALVIGVMAGAGFATSAFGAAIMIAGAATSALVCWWWPKFEAPAWKLWLVAVVANPLIYAGLYLWPTDLRCSFGFLQAEECEFSGAGAEFIVNCLAAPTVGLIVRRLWKLRRS